MHQLFRVHADIYSKAGISLDAVIQVGCLAPPRPMGAAPADDCEAGGLNQSALQALSTPAPRSRAPTQMDLPSPLSLRARCASRAAMKCPSTPHMPASSCRSACWGCVLAAARLRALWLGRAPRGDSPSRMSARPSPRPRRSACRAKSRTPCQTRRPLLQRARGKGGRASPAPRPLRRPLTARGRLAPLPAPVNTQGFASALDPEVNVMDAAAPVLVAYSLTGRAFGRLYA
jgi:hypothetical protein